MKTKQELADIMEADLGISFNAELIEFKPDPFIKGVYAIRYGPVLHLQTRLILDLPVEPIVVVGYNDEGCYEFYLVTPEGVEQVVFASWPPVARF
jgi:hypothetical protein